MIGITDIQKKTILRRGYTGLDGDNQWKSPTMYFLRDTRGPIKFGTTVNFPKRRTELNIGNPDPLIVEMHLFSEEPRKDLQCARVQLLLSIPNTPAVYRE